MIKTSSIYFAAFLKLKGLKYSIKQENDRFYFYFDSDKFHELKQEYRNTFEKYVREIAYFRDLVKGRREHGNKANESK